ncbi:hypothetical protein SAQ01S_08320 [Sphingomonas aquatilis NBRC 16722]|nr:hypothetical protein SAQ01S_08320 [Sphingomonas aquatilis NBRC 16722]
MKALPLQRLEHLGGGAPGEAVEQDGAIAKPDREAGRHIVMCWASAFATGAAPYPAKALDDRLCADFSVERQSRHRPSSGIVLDCDHFLTLR